MAFELKYMSKIRVIRRLLLKEAPFKEIRLFYRFEFISLPLTFWPNFVKFFC